MSQSANPLKSYFRQPVLYIRLPSGGQFWPAGSLDMPPNQELGVLPMTAMDEISFRTPDALFNGDAIIKVIQSCVPAIKDAWQTPGMDLNTILTAIRIASNGNTLDVNTKCPECSTENSYDINLRSVIDQIQPGDFSKSIKAGDIEIFFRPMSYHHQNEINLLQFEQQRILAYLPGADITEEERNAKLNQVLEEITKVTLKAVKYSIGAVKTPETLVTDSEHIEEFLNNCGATLFNQIKEHAVELRTADDLKPIKLKCPECGYDYEQPFVLDTALFFGNAS